MEPNDRLTGKEKQREKQRQHITLTTTTTTAAIKLFDNNECAIHPKMIQEQLGKTTNTMIIIIENVLDLGFL